MSDFETYLSHCLDEVKDSPVKEAMRYSLMAGGKRIRPRLLFAALTAYGLSVESGYPIAAAIEMIHTYSLIHDDLPAMDNDTLRRGLPTCHVKYGEDVAILAGDALLTQAFFEASKADIDAESLVAILRSLSAYSGADGMVLGQIKDLLGEANPMIREEELECIHYYKTGRLLTLPLVCAAYMAKAEQDIAEWEIIGAKLGLSFQIQDDVLDVTSSVEVLGKNIHSDEENEKTTYVTLLGIEAAKQKAQACYEQATQRVQALNIDSKELLELFAFLGKRKH